MHGHLPIPVNHQQQTRKNERASRTGPHRSTTVPQSPTNPHHGNPETRRHLPVPVSRPAQNHEPGRTSPATSHRNRRIPRFPIISHHGNPKTQRHLAVPVGSPIRNLKSGRTSSTTSRKSERFSHSPSSRHYGNSETHSQLPVPATTHPQHPRENRATGATSPRDDVLPRRGTATLSLRCAATPRAPTISQFTPRQRRSQANWFSGFPRPNHRNIHRQSRPARLIIQIQLRHRHDGPSQSAQLHPLIRVPAPLILVGPVMIAIVLNPDSQLRIR